MAKYCRLSYAERKRIEQLKKQGYGIRSISRIVCRSPSTISYELKRRFTPYCANTAQRDASRKALLRVKKRKIRGVLAELIIFLLIERRCSPEQISGYLRKKYPISFDRHISPESIYLWIYKHEKRKIFTQFLRRKRRYRRKRKKEGVQRGGIKNRVSIKERPLLVENREEVGHWEGDLIIGEKGRSAIGTLIERSSRYTFLVQVDNKKSKTVVEKFIAFLGRVPSHLRRTLTYDNGLEMALHEKISEQLQTKVYFANPRSPWQRGSNENTNGLIREFFPKSTDLNIYSQEELGGVAALLNKRPRKVLNYSSPEEAFEFFFERKNSSLSQYLSFI